MKSLAYQINIGDHTQHLLTWCCETLHNIVLSSHLLATLPPRQLILQYSVIELSMIELSL